jgi:hypothetical protein
MQKLTSSKLTEFDGIFSISYKAGVSTKNSELVIVEAKHYVSIDQINQKIYQMYFFKKILEKAKLVITDIKFNNFVKSFKLKNIYDFYFYIGGPTWEENSIEYLQKINSGLIDKIKWKSPL